MRILLKFVLDCPVDAAWRAIRSPEVFLAVAAPLLSFESEEPAGFPTIWPEGTHPVRALGLGVVPIGEQTIELAFEERADGVRLVHDTGRGVSGSLTLVTAWHHTMAVSGTADGRTLYRDRLEYEAGALTLAMWPLYWAFWQWRGIQLRRLARSWS